MEHEPITRDALMSNFCHLEQQFSLQKKDIVNKESKFDNLRKSFVETLRLQSHKLRLEVGPENPLYTTIEKTVQTIDGFFQNWEKQVQSRSKGTKFREGFNDSLLVFIYGKVKSGKSSLGNYIAWGHSDPTEELKAREKNQPQYFTTEQTNVASGDKENEAENTQQFRVGATEATSSIQGFRLPGLTWVDSPGLHSVNTINGDLATEYAEHADLILYTMHSQAPGRASDMHEIEELLNGNKKLMVLLTGSDTTEEDEDSEGNLVSNIVMKNEKDRGEQISYVRGELSKLINYSNSRVLADVLPISTRYAETYATPQGIIDSGIGRLLTELKTICNSHALELKINAPMENLRSSISTTKNDLDNIRELINNFSEGIDDQRAYIEYDLSIHGQEGRSRMSGYINYIFDDTKVKNIDTDLREKLTELLQTKALSVIEKIGEKQMAGFKQAFDASKLSKVPEYKEDVESKKYFTGVKRGNKVKLSLVGAVAGGVIGFLLGGPAGAAGGVSLGSSAGLAGSTSKAEYGTYDVVVGDNQEERRAHAMQIYANDFPDILRGVVDNLYGPIKKGMLDYCNALNAEITSLLTALDNLRKE